MKKGAPLSCMNTLPCAGFSAFPKPSSWKQIAYMMVVFMWQNCDCQYIITNIVGIFCVDQYELNVQLPRTEGCCYQFLLVLSLYSWSCPFLINIVNIEMKFEIISNTYRSYASSLIIVFKPTGIFSSKALYDCSLMASSFRNPIPIC